MAFLGKEYTFYKGDNYDSFLKLVGTPDAEIPKHSAFPITQKFEQNGDSYTHYINEADGPKETTFRSGVEFDDTIGNDKVKTTYVIDGNSVTQTFKSEEYGTTTIKNEYTDNQLVETITTDNWDGVAKLYFKA